MTGPHPAYNNPPIQPQFFQPSRFVISAITQGETTVVTTSDTQNYVVGQVVRMLIPQAYGSFQLNNKQGLVISLPSTTEVEIDIDSTHYDPFVPSPPTQTQNLSLPQIVAIADYNSGNINANGNKTTSTLIPGSFINISPA